MRINYLIILACIGASFWAWTQVTDAVFAQENLVFSYENLVAGRVWTLVTALFIHASTLHLFGNMLFLFVFGNTLEKMIGRNNHLLVFFVGGLTAFLLSLPFFPPDTGMLGASAAIFTTAAGVMLMKPLKFSWIFMMPQGLVAIVYFVYNVVIVYDPSSVPGFDANVGYIAHIIGFVVGVPFGIAWSTQWKKNLFITVVLFGVYLGLVAAFAVLFGPQSPINTFSFGSVFGQSPFHV
ncbi:MAG TPA: rhomboid family intramembrane serine protease [Candidatus Bathyarchaeia archaeon]